MTLKTLFRLLFGTLLLTAYWSLPRILPERPETSESFLGIQAGQVTGLVLHGLEEEALRLQKAGGGRWKVEGREAVYADPGVVGGVLGGLAGRQSRPVAGYAPTGHEPRLELFNRWRRWPVIALGPRLAPFRKQVIFVEDVAYEIDFDLNAALGLWEREGDWTSAALLENVPLAVDLQAIEEIRVDNVFATYEIKRSSDPPVGRWRATGSQAELSLSEFALQRLGEALRVVAVDGPAKAEALPAGLEPYSRISLGTEEGNEVAFGIAAGSDPGKRFLRMEAPERSDWLVVPAFAARDLVPDGGELFAPRLRLETGAEEARVVRYERGNRRVELVRGAAKIWKVTKPRRNRPIYRPPPMPGAPRQPDMVEEYIQLLETIVSRELFKEDTPARTELVSGAFDPPAARIIIEPAHGDATEILFSSPVLDTGRAFVSVNGRIGVVEEGLVVALTPDVEQFLAPGNVKERRVKR